MNFGWYFDMCISDFYFFTFFLRFNCDLVYVFVKYGWMMVLLGVFRNISDVFLN